MPSAGGAWASDDFDVASAGSTLQVTAGTLSPGQSYAASYSSTGSDTVSVFITVEAVRTPEVVRAFWEAPQFSKIKVEFDAPVAFARSPARSLARRSIDS